MLRSKSDHPFIAQHRSLIHKIGLTGGDVKSRIANARKEPTYLLADVEIVATFKLANVNRNALEALLHKIFGSDRLDMELKDRFGGQVKPREWFLVPLAVIDEAIQKSRMGPFLTSSMTRRQHGSRQRSLDGKHVADDLGKTASIILSWVATAAVANSIRQKRPSRTVAASTPRAGSGKEFFELQFLPMVGDGFGPIPTRGKNAPASAMNRIATQPSAPFASITPSPVKAKNSPWITKFKWSQPNALANIAVVVSLPAGGEWPRVRPADAETVPPRRRQVFRVSALLQSDVHKLSGIAQV